MPRPTTSNADEWQLWLIEHIGLQDDAGSGCAFLAVQIVEAIEEHQKALAREVYALAEATAERSSDLAMEDSPEGHYSRGMIAEAKGIARAVNAIMPYSRDPSALKPLDCPGVKGMPFAHLFISREGEPAYCARCGLLEADYKQAGRSQ